MNTGLLWFDNDPHTALLDKVERAADFYQRKYGRVPDMCLVHPSMLGTHTSQVLGKPQKVEVRAHRAIRPGHFWIGEDN